MKIVTATQMRTLDHRTITEAQVPSAVLMERAGAGAAKFIQHRFGPLRGKSITILCGKCNNVGDGLVVARLLRQLQARVTVFLLAPATDLSRDAIVMYRRWLRAGGKSSTKVFRSSEQARSILVSSDLIVDALLGTGLSATVTGAYREAIQLMNQAGKPVIAIDMPSGIHADNGTILGQAVHAAATITFGLPKLGLYVGPGIDHAGTIHVVDIGIPMAYTDALDTRIILVTNEQVANALRFGRGDGAY